MAVDKLVDSTQLNSDLTSVANAIRTKGGTSGQLAFPAGFVSAIGDISGDGGGNANVSQDANGFIVVDDAAPGGGGGTTIKKVTGSFTPSSNVSHFEVTGLGNPPIVVLVLIHDASNTALDGTVKCLGGIYAYGDSVILQTNSGGTGYGRDQNNSLIPTWLDNYTVYPDGELAPTATIIATETGFAFKCIAATNYWLKDGYTYDWVAYTYPTPTA